MQTVNANKPVTVTARHMPVTDAIREYCHKKIDGLHLDYPKIVGAHFILAVDKHRQRAELVLHCNNHITIESHNVCDDLYASIDAVINKSARQMRKYKTRLLRGFRPHRQKVRYIKEHLLDTSFLEAEAIASAPKAKNGSPARTAVPEIESTAAPEPEVEAPAPSSKIVSSEKYAAKPMLLDEAVLQLELWERDFLVFLNVGTERLNVLYRRKDGGYALIQPD
jgi:putative sigma-54 modulation protein